MSDNGSGRRRPRRRSVCRRRLGASLTVALVGPTHPYKGGVAAHTTTLAHELAEAGHEVTLVSWSHLYPSALYPGEQSVPGGSPDVDPFPRTLRVLSWARPDTWVRAGRRLRDVDVIVVVHVIPAVVPGPPRPAPRRRGRAAPRADRAAGRARVVIAHNVLPHEGHPGDRQLMEALLRRVDAVVVHSDDQASLAAALGATPRQASSTSRRTCPAAHPSRAAARTATTAPSACCPSASSATTRGSTSSSTPLRDVPGIRLTVAGELWGDAGRRVRELAADPRLDGPGRGAQRLRARRPDRRPPGAPRRRRPDLPLGDGLAERPARPPPRSPRAGQRGGHLPRAGARRRRRAARPALATARRSSPPCAASPSPGASTGSAPRCALPTCPAPGRTTSAASRPSPPLRSTPRRRRRPCRWARSARARATVAGIRARRGPVVELGPRGHPRAGAGHRPARARRRRRRRRRHRSRARPAPARASRSRRGRPWARWPPSCGSATTGTAPRSSSTSPAAAARWAAGRAPSASHRSSSSSPGGEPPSRCSTSTPRASTSSPGCTRAAARHPTSTTPSARRPGRCARAGCSSLTVPIGDDDPDFAVRPADVRGILARADDLGLRLVGDVDGDVLDRMRDARTRGRGGRRPGIRRAAADLPAPLMTTGPARPARTHRAGTRADPTRRDAAPGDPRGSGRQRDDLVDAGRPEVPVAGVAAGGRGCSTRSASACSSSSSRPSASPSGATGTRCPASWAR